MIYGIIFWGLFLVVLFFIGFVVFLPEMIERIFKIRIRKSSFDKVRRFKFIVFWLASVITVFGLIIYSFIGYTSKKNVFSVEQAKQDFALCWNKIKSEADKHNISIDDIYKDYNDDYYEEFSDFSDGIHSGTIKLSYDKCEKTELIKIYRKADYDDIANLKELANSSFTIEIYNLFLSEPITTEYLYSFLDSYNPSELSYNKSLDEYEYSDIGFYDLRSMLPIVSLVFSKDKSSVSLLLSGYIKKI